MEIKGKRVIVTGGCGFIGSHLVEKLAGLGNEVIVIDNLVTGKLENLNNVSGEVKHHNLNILDRLDEQIEDAYAIFHLAANVSVIGSVEDPVYDAENNIMGTLNILEHARRLDIKKVIYSSSTAVYGDNITVPTGEDQKPTATSPYGNSKFTGENFTRLYAQLYGIETVSLRYFNVYGKRQAADSPYSGVIAIFIKNALAGLPITIYGDGEQSRDFIEVSDVVKANLLALERSLHGEAINIGTGVATTINGLADIIEEISGKLEREYQPERKGEIKISQADIALAAEALGFEPRISLQQGLKDLYENSRTD